MKGNLEVIINGAEVFKNYKDLLKRLQKINDIVFDWEHQPEERPLIDIFSDIHKLSILPDACEIVVDNLDQDNLITRYKTKNGELIK